MPTKDEYRAEDDPVGKKIDQELAAQVAGLKFTDLADAEDNFLGDVEDGQVPQWNAQDSLWFPFTPPAVPAIFKSFPSGADVPAFDAMAGVTDTAALVSGNGYRVRGFVRVQWNDTNDAVRLGFSGAYTMLSSAIEVLDPNVTDGNGNHISLITVVADPFSAAEPFTVGQAGAGVTELRIDAFILATADGDIGLSAAYVESAGSGSDVTQAGAYFEVFDLGAQT